MLVYKYVSYLVKVFNDSIAPIYGPQITIELVVENKLKLPILEWIPPLRMG